MSMWWCWAGNDDESEGDGDGKRNREIGTERTPRAMEAKRVKINTREARGQVGLAIKRLRYRRYMHLMCAS
jgi:hypothetical protein